MRRIQFLTILLFALSLVPGGAHLLEMTTKMTLDRDAYMMVQQIYQGWAMLGIVQIGAMFAGLLLVIMSRSQRLAFRLALAGFVLLGSALAGFFLWTFPTNKATANWTMAPENWEQLRMQWEYSHAGNAVLIFLALCCVIGSSLSWRVVNADTARR